MLRFSGQKDKWFKAGWLMKRDEYKQVGELRVPSTLEVSWKFGDSEFAQVRARITDIDHNVRLKY